MKYLASFPTCILMLACFGMLTLAACSTDSDESDDDNFDASIVCPAEGTNAYGMPNRGTFVDERDGQEYRYTTIGNQVWMAENLNYDALGSICQDRDPSKCELYGRLYSYVGHDPDHAIDTINWNFIDSVCPNGWHLPTLTEWKKLGSFVGGMNTEKAALRLKSVVGWEKSNWGAGIDACAFSVLPGVFFSYESSSEGNSALFLTATAEFEDMNNLVALDKELVYGPSPGRYSIRCIKN